METKTLPAHVVFDEHGELSSVALLNDKTRVIEFYSVTKLTFEDVGQFLKDLTPKNATKKTTTPG